MKNFTLFSLLFLSTQALAMGTLNSFTENTAISSSLMNSNFTLTKTAVDALEATNIGYYVFPLLQPSVGQVLTSTATGLAWQVPGGGGSGITSINGDTSMVQNFSVGTSGYMPAFTNSVGNHILNIPMAGSAGTTAGLISYSDYLNFTNKLSAPAGSMGQVLTFTGSQWVGQDGVTLGGNTMPGNIGVGTMGPYSTSLRTNGMDRLTVDSSGYVGVGVVPNMISKLAVDAGSVNVTGGSVIQAAGTLQGGSGEQSGILVAPTINQTGTASFAGLKVDVQQGPTGSGTKKLLDLAKTGVSVFSVDMNGYIASQDDWMGSMTQTSPNIMCIAGEPALNQRHEVVGINPDFGVPSNSISVAGVYEILIDTPMVGSGSDFKINNVLVHNGANIIPLHPGRNIKRLAVGNYSFFLGCTSASSVNATITGAMAVLGIRKLH